jgi:hypothetical protein
MTPATLSVSSALDYKQVAERALTIGNRMNAWITEAVQLESLPALTAEQENRLDDISNALNSYDLLLEDALEDPKEDWVERAVKGMGVN